MISHFLQVMRLSIDWMIIYCLKSRSKIFDLYGGANITGEGLHLSWWSVLRTCEQGGFILPHQLWHGVSVFLVSSEGSPHFGASCDTQGDEENPILTRIFSQAPVQSLLKTHKGVCMTYSSLDPHGLIPDGSRQPGQFQGSTVQVHLDIFNSRFFYPVFNLHSKYVVDTVYAVQNMNILQ
jgi:hypothetical protein